MTWRVLILGSSHVGASLAGELVDQGCEVTVVCDQQVSLKKLQHQFDIRTVLGNPSYPDILRTARADCMDVMIATTAIDEVNMLACQVAYSLFKIPTKIARIRSRHYFYRNELFGNDDLPVDVFLDPERAVAQQLFQLLHYIGAANAFALPHIAMVLLTVKVTRDGPWAQRTWRDFQMIIGEHSGLGLAVQREQHYIRLSDHMQLQAQDECYIMVAEGSASILLQAMGLQEHDRIRKVIIAGGGGVGESLAERLSSRQCNVKIIDHNEVLCQRLASDIPAATVLVGDASERKLLFQENVEAVDAFIALTSDDEDNIISSLQAKYLGARHVVALVNNSEYMEIFSSSAVDIFIPPQQTSISDVLTVLRPSFVHQVHSLARGQSEIVCFELLEGKAKRLVGKTISQLHIPDSVIFAGIYRDGVGSFSRSVELTYGDYVVFLLQDKHLYGVIALWFG